MTTSADCVGPHPEGTVVRIRAVPRAHVDRVDGVVGGQVRIRVRAAPTDGRATSAVREVLARHLGIPPRRVTLLSGPRARSKRYLVTGLQPPVVAARLGLPTDG